MGRCKSRTGPFGGRVWDIFKKQSVLVSQCLLKTLLSEQKQSHVVLTVNNGDGEMSLNNNSSLDVFHDS